MKIELQWVVEIVPYRVNKVVPSTQLDICNYVLSILPLRFLLCSRYDGYPTLLFPYKHV